MNRDVATYLCSVLSDHRKVDERALTTALCYIQKWRGQSVAGADDVLARQLEEERLDAEVVSLIQQYLLTFARQTHSTDLYLRTLDVLIACRDPALIPVLRDWLRTQMEQLLVANRNVYALMSALESAGETTFTGRGREVTHMTENVEDGRQYLREKMGARLPW